MEYTFTVIGGDKRQEELIHMLLNGGHRVNAMGFHELRNPKVNLFKGPERELVNCHVLVLPVPYRNKKGGINIKCQGLELSLWDMVRLLGDKKPIIVLGKADGEFIEIAKAEGIDFLDLTEEETFAILNAIPTAEGAIQRAMEMTNITIHGSQVLVLGYGRIGKSLSRMLKGIGAEVTVAARKREALAWIDENGYRALPLWELDGALPYQDIIFNTIPKLIMDEEKLSMVKDGVIIIDLASAPGGVDFVKAREKNIKATLEPGLPGIVAPKTAAEIIYRIMMDYIDKKMQIREAIP